MARTPTWSDICRSDSGTFAPRSACTPSPESCSCGSTELAAAPPREAAGAIVPGLTVAESGIFAGAGLGALFTVAAIGSAGAGAAATLNNTVLRDDPTLDAHERIARSAGRVASYSGAAVGTVATVGAIGASGSVVGLSGAGIASGVAALGAGSAVLGTLTVLAAPAVIAGLAGFGIYKLWQAFD